MARYVISKEEWVKNIFYNTLCADELFLQTIVVNSDFINKLYYKEFDDNMIANMRFIDWKRGMPYVFRENDFNELINTDLLFARKFDYEIDRNIIDKIFNYLKNDYID